MTDFKTPNDALVEALVLAVTAPTEDQSKMAVELAEKIAAGLSEIEVSRAKYHAKCRLNEVKPLDEDGPPFM